MPRHTRQRTLAWNVWPGGTSVKVIVQGATVDVTATVLVGGTLVELGVGLCPVTCVDVGVRVADGVLVACVVDVAVDVTTTVGVLAGLQLFNSTDAVSEPAFAVAISKPPSRLKSSTATANGLEPTGKLTGAPNPPMPLPNITTAVDVKFPPTTRSGRPSWLNSATNMDKDAP